MGTKGKGWKRLALWGMCGLLVAIMALWIAALLLPYSRGTPAEGVIESLKSIARAQADVRKNDLDGDGKSNYWRSDIAGLHMFEREGKTLLTGLSSRVARADDRRATVDSSFPVPMAIEGFLLRALRFPDETKLDPNRWAACAFPEKYGRGTALTYIISHEGAIYKKDLGRGGGLNEYPADPVAEDWAKVQ